MKSTNNPSHLQGIVAIGAFFRLSFFNKKNSPKTFLRIGSYYKTTIDKLKIMNHLKLLTKYK